MKTKSVTKKLEAFRDLWFIEGGVDTGEQWQEITDIINTLNKVQNPEVCDATTDDKNGEADPQINPDPLGNGELEVYVETHIKSDDDLPKKNGWYWCIDVNSISVSTVKEVFRFDAYNKSWFDFDGNVYYPTHWLKKVMASSIKK